MGQVRREHAISNTLLLPFQPGAMTPTQLAAVSDLARFSGHTHQLYASGPKDVHLRRPGRRSRPEVGLTRRKCTSL